MAQRIVILGAGGYTAGLILERLTILDAIRLLGPGDSDIRRAAEEARGIFERVGARRSLAMLDAALASGGTDRASGQTATGPGVSIPVFSDGSAGSGR